MYKRQTDDKYVAVALAAVRATCLVHALVAEDKTTIPAARPSPVLSYLSLPRGFSRGSPRQDLKLLPPLTCVVDEAVKPVGPSQNLVAQLVHAAQRAQVRDHTLHPLTLSTSFHELDGCVDGGLSTTVHEYGRAVLGEFRCGVPACGEYDVSYAGGILVRAQ